MTAPDLPDRFRPLLAAARAGELPRGPVGLAKQGEGMTFAQQQAFAAYLRARIPKPKGAKWHSLEFIHDFARRIVRRRFLHWRDLTVGEAREVMAAAQQQYGGQP